VFQNWALKPRKKIKQINAISHPSKLHIKKRRNIMKIDKNSVILITGATAGIGLTTAKYLAGRGFKVVGTHRPTSNTHDLDQAIAKSKGKLEKVMMDVTDEHSVQEGVKEILKSKKIGVVINNAGYAMVGTIESCTLAQQKELFETNVFGVVRVIQAVLPHFRAEGKGQIINIGSVVGITPFPAIEVYSASKFALEGYTESMAVSLSPFNIKVSIIEPGGVKTQAASHHSPIGSADLGPNNPYLDYHEKANDMCISNLAHGSEPKELAKLIHQVIVEEKPKLRYQFTDFAIKEAEARFKDLTGSISVEKQTQFFTEAGLFKSMSRKTQNS
jgi:short-subunit dehydrogenase